MPEIAKQSARSTLKGTDEKHVRFAVAVKIEKADTSAGSRSCGMRRRRKRQLSNRVRHKLHGDCRWHSRPGRARELRERKAPLLAVARSHRGAEMALRDFLEARQVLARRVGIAFALIRARNAEFRRGMQRIQADGALKRGDGFLELLLLGEQHADEVKTVRFVRRNLCHMAKCRDGLVSLVQVLIGKAQVVRSVGVRWQLCGG